MEPLSGRPAPSTGGDQLRDHGTYVGAARWVPSGPLPGGSVDASGGGWQPPVATSTSSGVTVGAFQSTSVTSPISGSAGLVTLMPRSASMPAWSDQHGVSRISASIAPYARAVA